jgi:hypothetical protein
MAPYISADKAGLLSTLLEGVLYGWSYHCIEFEWLKILYNTFAGRFLCAHVHRRSLDISASSWGHANQLSHDYRRLSPFRFEHNRMCSASNFQMHGSNVSFKLQHLGVDFNRLVVAFVTLRDSYPGGPSAWFANPSQRSFIIKNAVYTFQTVLGDGVVVEAPLLSHFSGVR